MKNALRVLFCILFIMGVAFAQTKEVLRTQAEQKLQSMTPEEIDAKIKEYGYTREEAEARAKEYGIDLETFLQRTKLLSTHSGTQAPTVQINLQSPPTTTLMKDTSAPKATPMGTEVLSAPIVQKPKIVPVQQEQPKAGELDFFGYSIFRTPRGAFEPRPYIDNEYVIGEGDVLKISLWGQVQSYNEYPVDAEGRITIGEIGPVFVTGYTLGKAKTIVLNAMAKAFSGLAKSPPTMFMDLNVARIRPMRVFIMGEVANPGGYAVSSFGSVFNSLFAVGGPKTSGSLRDVRLIRNNKVIAKVDLYDYLLGAQKTNDVRINDNDLIFVPLRGRTVGIRGEVLRAVKFELQSDENLRKLIEFSGGLRNNIYLERIQVSRIIPFNERVTGDPERKVFDVDFRELVKSNKDYKLEDGDVVTLFPVLDRQENYVHLLGAVYRPGTFQKEKIKNIQQLVKAADGLLPEAYVEKGEVIRTFPDKRRQILTFNVSSAIEGKGADNLILMERDTVRIYSCYEINPQRTYALEGKAKNPGTYLLADNLKLSELLPFVVGLSDTSFRKGIMLESADLVRLNPDQITSRIIRFNLWKLFTEKLEDTTLLPGDRIIIYPREAVEIIDRYVEIFGNVKKPGKYRYAENMTLIDLLLQAGGYTDDAWPYQAEIARLSRFGLSKDSLVYTRFAALPDLFDTTDSRLNQTLENRAGSYKLQARDQVFVRPNPQYIVQRLVTLAGEVQHAGKYALNIHGERLSHVIQRAGGFTLSGYARGSELLRNGERLRLNVEEVLKEPNGSSDVTLLPGDSLYVPRKPSTVTVRGEVQNPGTYGFVDGQLLSDYLTRAGGETDSSDYAIITFPEGDSKQVGLGWFASNPKMPDGSLILVAKVPAKPPEPEQKEKTTTFDLIKDTLAIMVSAITIIVLASKL